MQSLGTIDRFLASAVVLMPMLFLLSARIGAALAALPAPLGDVAPMRIRATLAFLVALVLTLPHRELAEAVGPRVMHDPWALLPAVVGEVLLGGAIGLVVRLALGAVSIGGALMGFSSGLAFAQSVDPALGEMSTPVSRGLNALAVAIFFSLEGHHAVLSSLAHSVQTAPPGHVLGALVDGGVFEGAFNMGARIFDYGLRIAAPVMATLFMVQVGLALASRAAPRVHIFQLSFAIAVSAGLITLDLAMPSITPTIAQLLREIPTLLGNML